MAFEDILSAANISGTGLSAERFRMEVVANNIANAFATRTPGGGPFRRQDVVFETLLNDRVRPGPGGLQPLAGVQVAGVVDDPSDLQRLYQPGHPDADQDGFILMPNVQLPIEMVNLITATRAYEANLKVLQTFRQQAELALSIGR